MFVDNVEGRACRTPIQSHPWTSYQLCMLLLYGNQAKTLSHIYAKVSSKFISFFGILGFFEGLSEEASVLRRSTFSSDVSATGQRSRQTARSMSNQVLPAALPVMFILSKGLLSTSQEVSERDAKK